MPSKDPMLVDKVILKYGGDIETQDGTPIIEVSSTGVVTIATGTDTIAGANHLNFRDTSTYLYSSSAGTINTVASGNINLTVGGNSVTVSASGLTGAIKELLTYTATTGTPGTNRTITGVTTSASTLTSGTLVGVRGEANIPASGSTASGTYMYGTQGKLICGATSTINSGSGHVCGVLGQLDISNATTTSGHLAGVISSVQDTTNTARTILNGFYAELPEYGSGAKANSVLQGFGGVTYGLDLSGNHMDYLFTIGTEATSGGAGSAGAIKIATKIGGTTYYVNAYTS